MSGEKILGCDPSLTMTGLSVIKFHVEQPPELVHARAIDALVAFGDFRLRMIAEIFEATVLKYGIEIVGIEENYLHKGRSVHTALRHREVIGVLVERGIALKCDIRRVSPSEAKKAMTGNGQAKKTEVLRCFNGMFGERHGTVAWKKAVADAAAVAFATTTGRPAAD